MSLSSDLISQFAKITKNEKKRNVESTVYGTIVDYDDSFYVRLDGSDLLTPIASTAEVRSGERVTVLLKNHSATVIGNISSPSAGTETVVEISTETVGGLMADKASVEDLNAERARINSLVANDVSISQRLTSAEADIVNLETANITVSNTLNAYNADIETLKTDKLDASSAAVIYATVENLDATNANVTNLQTNKLDASEASITYATIAQLEAMDIDVEKLSAISADINDLKATKLDASVAAITYATIEQLDSIDISTETLSAINAEIDSLKTGKLDAEEASITYANVDFTNIGKAAMEYFYANSGLIENVVIGDSTITGKLVGVTITGDLIEANTLVADKLVIQGEDGLYYKLNTDGVSIEAEQTEYNSLDGSVITAKTITASKISVDDLVAFDATIGGFNITEDSLYSGVKESVDNTTRGVYVDDDGQMAVGDESRYLKYYRDTDGTYKLAICADAITFTATGSDLLTDLSEIQNDIDDIESRVKNAETKIDQTSEAIALSATKTEVATAKSEAISAASSDATTKANDALVTANTNTTNLLKSYSTTADMNSAIELKADSITNTVSATYATKNELENIEVGGRNLLYDSGLSYSNTSVTTDYGYWYLASDTYSHGIMLEPNQKYVLSFDWEVDWDTCELFAAYVGIGVGRSPGRYDYDIVHSTKIPNCDAEHTSGRYSYVFNSSGNGVSLDEFPYFAMRPIRCSAIDGLHGSKWTISNLKLEKGNKPTDWTPAPEDVYGDIDAIDVRLVDAETKILQNAEAITLRATKTEVNTAKTEAISAASSDAATKANNALSSANANTANLLKNYSTTAEMNSAIQLKADSITSSVSSTYATKSALTTTNNNVTTAQNAANAAQADVDALSVDISNNYATKSEVTQTANSITSSVSSTYATKTALATTDANLIAAQNAADAAQADIDGLTIGGRNLIKDTSDEFTDILMASDSYYRQYGTDVELEAGQTYTFSVYVEKVSEDDFPINLHIGCGNKGNYNKDLHSWRKDNIPMGVKTSITYTVKESDVETYNYFSWRLRNEQKVTSIRFKEAKLEKGTRATDWSPCPDDTKADISALDTRVLSAESSIIQLSNSISSNVSETTKLGTRMSTVEQTASGLTTRLTAAETDIANAAKTATNYLNYSNGGLVVGNMTSSTLGNNVLIDSDSVDIRNDTTVLASFGANHLYLAKNSRNATIDMCNGLATIYHASKYSYDSLFVIDTAVVEMIGVGGTPLCLTSQSTLENVSIQFANSDKVLGGIGIIGSWLRRYGSNMFDTYTILDKGNFHDVMDSGWVYCTYGDGFTRYSNSQANLQVRKVGKQVYLRGEAKPTTAVTPSDDSNTVLAVIPEGYRPSYRQTFVMQGSAAYRWLMSVYPSGNLVISRYTNDTTMNKPISAGAWLCCYASWIID